MKYRFKNIGIEVTSICNNACKVCPRETKYIQPAATMGLELFKKIVLDLHNDKIEPITRLSGMGDPGCDKLLIERLRFCKEKTDGLGIVVLSNMGVWPKHYSDVIIEEGLLSKIRFSVFAVTEQTSLKIYGNRMQAINARKNIEYFIERNEKAGHPIKTLTYTLLLDENNEEMDLIKETYWDAVDEFEIWKPHNWSNVFPHLREKQSKTRKCYRIENFEASIRVNGDVCACSMDINHKIKYGNLKEQSILEVYESDLYKYYRDLNRSGQIETLATCKSCSFLNEDESDVIIESKDVCCKEIDR